MPLTFDGGRRAPPPTHDILKEESVPATFFLQEGANRHPPRNCGHMADEGHEIANHTWSHKNPTALTQNKCARKSSPCKNITNATGKTPTLMRQPSGATNHTASTPSRTLATPNRWACHREGLPAHRHPPPSPSGSWTRAKGAVEAADPQQVRAALRGPMGDGVAADRLTEGLGVPLPNLRPRVTASAVCQLAQVGLLIHLSGNVAFPDVELRALRDRERQQLRPVRRPAMVGSLGVAAAGSPAG
ncbi:polysaccharide deacetylase family protein [Streptomyces sp. NPDC058623]|uniref:polysaccharide deacetylase family protein n=1 Tax=Streptomyces sp. NPDC058623 TaxID=3346563 RepID=UPI0036571EA9